MDAQAVVDYLARNQSALAAGATYTSPFGRMLSVKAACEKLGRRETWLFERLQSKELRCIYLGRNPMFPEVWLDAFIAQQAMAQGRLDLQQGGM